MNEKLFVRNRYTKKIEQAIFFVHKILHQFLMQSKKDTDNQSS